MANRTMILAVLLAFVIPSLPAAAADRTVVRTKVVSTRYVGHMHYYQAYPWWWHQPYSHRARTNYQPWPFVTVREPNYDLPHVDGVVGFRVL